MRIAQDLPISRVRKAGKSLTVRSAARFTRGRSGRTRFGLDLRHESERGPASLPDARKWLARTLYSPNVAKTNKDTNPKGRKKVADNEENLRSYKPPWKA